MRRKLIQLILAAAFFGMIVPYGAPVYFERLKLAAALRAQPMDQRKTAVLGRWYEEAAGLRNSIPGESSVDIIMASPSARDIAVFAGSVLQPRDVRYFDSRESWRQRSRAQFFHDDRAANAAPSPLPTGADFVIEVDPDSLPLFKVIGSPR